MNSVVVLIWEPRRIIISPTPTYEQLQAWQNNYISEIKLHRNYPSIIAGTRSFRSNPKSLVASTRGTDPRGNLT
jgi:hypothetical protein